MVKVGTLHCFVYVFEFRISVSMYFLLPGYNYEVEGTRSFDGTVVAIGSIGEAFYNGLWAYDGW